MSIRIGTRDSALALWQAEQVAIRLRAMGHAAELVPMKSSGDLQPEADLRSLAGTGVFTRELDRALLERTIDVAVHSLKDYPTRPPDGVAIAAVLPRHDPADILVYKEDPVTFGDGHHRIATGSIRRSALWLNRFPHHNTENLRGNVATRLRKLADNPWSGAIFALAGLERIGLLPENHVRLDWMIPAPAQGVIGMTCRENDGAAREALAAINDPDAWVSSEMERGFLRELEGGCAAPIGALATWTEDRRLHFRGVVLSPDGAHKVDHEEIVKSDDPQTTGRLLARAVLDKGGRVIMEALRRG